jgi:hypothetical protein
MRCAALLETVSSWPVSNYREPLGKEPQGLKPIFTAANRRPLPQQAKIRLAGPPEGLLYPAKIYIYSET